MNERSEFTKSLSQLAGIGKNVYRGKCGRKKITCKTWIIWKGHNILRKESWVVHLVSVGAAWGMLKVVKKENIFIKYFWIGGRKSGPKCQKREYFNWLYRFFEDIFSFLPVTYAINGVGWRKLYWKMQKAEIYKTYISKFLFMPKWGCAERKTARKCRFSRHFDFSKVSTPVTY